ncbi:hypothetical protein Vadar_006983 [Vaccinium darrowii]|uniref:Uncharacterized protein n=1 Tax=Vaccinium darrowii TaxID=229202 RepID=A0ACB7WYR7_9ERIC|nr:hypothetical protein Vadar_006983 [Vaccinium darrowii]
MHIWRLEDMLDAFAGRVAKPWLFLTDKMQIALLRVEVGCPRDTHAPGYGGQWEYSQTGSTAAIIALAFVTIHTSSMVIAFNGYAENRVGQLFVPIVHLVAEMMMLILSTSFSFGVV